MIISPSRMSYVLIVSRYVKTASGGINTPTRTTLCSALYAGLSTMQPLRVQTTSGWTERAQRRAWWYPVAGLIVKPGDIMTWTVPVLDMTIDHVVHWVAYDVDGGYMSAILQEVLQ